MSIHFILLCGFCAYWCALPGECCDRVYVSVAAADGSGVPNSAQAAPVGPCKLTKRKNSCWWPSCKVGQGLFFISLLAPYTRIQLCNTYRLIYLSIYLVQSRFFPSYEHTWKKTVVV